MVGIGVVLDGSTVTRRLQALHRSSGVTRGFVAGRKGSPSRRYLTARPKEHPMSFFRRALDALDPCRRRRGCRPDGYVAPEPRPVVARSTCSATSRREMPCCGMSGSGTGHLSRPARTPRAAPGPAADSDRRAPSRSTTAAATSTPSTPAAAACLRSRCSRDGLELVDVVASGGVMPTSVTVDRDVVYVAQRRRSRQHLRVHESRRRPANPSPARRCRSAHRARPAGPGLRSPLTVTV